MSAEDAPQPPPLFDVVIPGEQVRKENGPWLHPRPGEADEPPGARRPGVDEAALAERFRDELERRLPEALEQAQRPVRRAVDDAFREAVSAARRPAEQDSD
ncbi:hypothetical protein [Halorhodospira neutriphila]|uniref:Uncharacterized protein n=1 Tax=Halorhodospira neutriphila TaxID=168379 RepID=A0ABS1E8P3_9GAMM|nr:hypothetical protein [Halorhodospira neutriphila]MBK1727417.1 hypothetical protein [Halorhodospira neutriphila]